MDKAMMKPQASIKQQQTEQQSYFTVSVESNGSTKDIEAQFTSFQQALDFVMENDWQVKREPVNSSHVEMRFLKP